MKSGFRWSEFPSMRQRKHGRAGDCEFSGVSPAIDTALGKHIPTWKEQVFKLASGRIQERHSRERVHPGTPKLPGQQQPIYAALAQTKPTIISQLNRPSLI